MGTRTALFSRQQPGGVFDITNLEKHPGDVWFVYSGAGAQGADSAGYGRNPDAPFLTLAYAMSLCTANKGDVIYLLPGHAETLTTAVACSVAGVRIIGLGTGLDRPEFTLGANGIDGLNITADGVVVDNIYFAAASVSAGAANVNIAAANVTIRNVHMDMGANDRVGITITAAGEKPLIEKCTCIVSANGPGAWIDIEGVIDMPIIQDNYIVGSDGTNEFDRGCIDFSAQAITNPIVIRNVFDGADDATPLAAIGDAASCVGDCFSGNYYAGGTTNGDTVATVTATIGAGTITDASFGAGAINAAAIAADAIGAAEIADGAIDAATFAADALVAATFATGALTADAFAANAIVAATLNADCITNAKIADGALAAEQFALSAGEKTTDGIVVTRATGVLPQTTALALFTVTGHVLLKRILGVVTTAIGNVANVAHLRLNSTGAGATTDLCLAAGGLDIDNDAADTTYEITGTVGEAMVATTNLPKTRTQLLDLMLVPGSLELACAGSSGTGSIRWSVTYVPMEAGAQMVAV